MSGTITNGNGNVGETENKYQFSLINGLLALYPIMFKELREKQQQQHSSTSASDAYCLAGFDLDGTLIRPQAGRNQFDKSPDNWRWLYPETVTVLRDLQSKGFLIVIFSNQGGWSYKTVSREREQNKLVQRMGKIISELIDHGISPIIYCALGRGADAPFRKPERAMYDKALADLGISHHQLREAFYCGDAGGEEGDHSNCDLEFAMNIGITYFRPEKLFHFHK